MVDSFERLGLDDLCFLDEKGVASGGLAGLDALAVSGGDAFALAGALGPEGAEAIESFVRSGGLYLGSCAGAYLCLRSSKAPLNLFNFVQARISNLARELPQPLMLAEKFSTPYGCAHVFHPVREAVWLAPAEEGPWSGGGRFAAPLYGGPAMLPDDPCLAMATYADFHPRTRFLAPRELAEATLLGRAAALRAPLGAGWLHLYGPHLEHPGFAEANRLMAEALTHDLPDGPPASPPASPPSWLAGEAVRGLARQLRREVSNSRIVAAGLEDHPVRWRIGAKVYEPAKFRVFLEAAWRRVPALERASALPLAPEESLALGEGWQEITAGLRGLRRALEDSPDPGRDTTGQANRLFDQIKRACVGLLTLHFAARGPRGGISRPH